MILENFQNIKKEKEINYTVGEDEVAGYATEINDFDITNTHKILKTSVNVTKNGMIKIIKMVNVLNKLLFIYTLMVKILEKH